MASKHDILALADRFQEATGLPDVTLSSRVFKDSKRLPALRGKSDLTVSRYQKAIHYFASHWPAGAEWPADVPRPSIEGDAQ